MHGSGKLAADALAVRGGAERQALTQSHIRSDAGYLALPQDGEKVAPVEDAAVPAAGGVALFDMVLAALVHGFADLLPEAGWRKVGRLAVDQPPVSRSRVDPICLFRSTGKDANAGLTVSAGVMGGGTADQIIGDAPLVGVDRSTIRRRSAPAAHMGIDIAS
uniref:Uncharacterized protein n=1 Tax=Salmonella enterica subsp. enterica serovar London TaxID=149390 RepID=A0A3G8EWD2_SALET|nr:hypothetical protein KADIGFNM_00232 [Salmonella enterica subsp. enterica serovar London]AZF85736.1 hypothetical protein KADIGFNM_00399 [Salmonella enterica subsp. enterica serovar London]